MERRRFSNYTLTLIAILSAIFLAATILIPMCSWLLGRSLHIVLGYRYVKWNSNHLCQALRSLWKTLRSAMFTIAIAVVEILINCVQHHDRYGRHSRGYVHQGKRCADISVGYVRERNGHLGVQIRLNPIVQSVFDRPRDCFIATNMNRCFHLNEYAVACKRTYELSNQLLLAKNSEGSRSWNQLWKGFSWFARGLTELSDQLILSESSVGFV